VGRPPVRAASSRPTRHTRRAFERIGPFDADICIGDALLSWRAQGAGLTPWFEPRAVVEHWHQRFVEYLREFFHRGRELVVAQRGRAGAARYAARRRGHAVRCAAFPVTALMEIAWVRDARGRRRWPWL
jgi:hypothetical protein